MHKWRYQQLLATSLWLVVGLAWGCRDAKQESTHSAENTATKIPSAFNAKVTGTIQGQVTWRGEFPLVAPFHVYANPGGGDALKKRQLQPNPNAPRINPQTRGVGNAVVFLRGVDASKSKAWSQPPVLVEQRSLQFHVHQGETDSSYGFVRKGDPIAMVSRDAFSHALHASEASFFTLMFPDPDQPVSRPFKEKGLVELSSAAGCYWMRAYLFVDEHPYYARTDLEGRFTLKQVPPGHYDVVCWMPNWRKARHERDPETGLVTRLFFGPPVELTENAKVRPKETREIQFAVSAGAFKP